MRFPPDVHRPLGNNTQRARPAPLNLDAQHHPAAAPLPSIEQTLQSQGMRVPPSPTPSSTSSLSLYSYDSAKKSSRLGAIQEEEEGEESKKGGGFCLCFSASFYLLVTFYILSTKFHI